MRNADVRRACLALIDNRACADEPGLDPSPAALGWQLENSRASARAMAALCAGALAGTGATRWQPSPALLALLQEYGDVRRPDQRGSRVTTGGCTADALH